MPKTRKKKSSAFESSPVKSVFLFGKPNKGKLDVLWQMERQYVELINFNIEALMAVPDIHVQLVKNDKKDSYVRQLQNSYVQETSILHSVRMPLILLLQSFQTGWMQYVWKCSRLLILSSASPRYCLVCVLMVQVKMK